MRRYRLLTLFLGLWLLSTVAFSSGEFVPEQEFLESAKSSPEYSILRELQEVSLELQLFELMIKNRSDSKLEGKIAQALSEVKSDGLALGKKFRQLQEGQLENLYLLINLAGGFGKQLGIGPRQWTELFDSIKENRVSPDGAGVHARWNGNKMFLSVFQLSSLRIANQSVWNISIPKKESRNFWNYARRLPDAKEQLRAKALNEKLAPIQEKYKIAELEAENYYKQSYQKLYNAFEDHRFGIIRRVIHVRKSLNELSRQNGAMGTPEEFAALYNQVLEHLFSYGVDVSLTGLNRDFTVKGFLFADTPEQAGKLYQRLRYTPASTSYNSPSS